ncbi:MAG TPA: hypothetical protein VLQ79_08175 [Myxococcaceae bacterium]|nr:hypothetical protein [Myxococcaceae bacterium]
MGSSFQVPAQGLRLAQAPLRRKKYIVGTWSNQASARMSCTGRAGCASFLEGLRPFLFAGLATAFLAGWTWLVEVRQWRHPFKVLGDEATRLVSAVLGCSVSSDGTAHPS